MSPDHRPTFLPALRRLERELRLPILERLKIVRELAFDLEQLQARLMEQGVPAADAGARALDTLVPEGGALGDLRRLHAGPYGRLTRHLPDGTVRALERTALALATLAVLATGTVLMAGADLLRDPSPFLWPVLGLGGLVFAAVAANGFGLWIKGDHARPARGLWVILALSGITLAVGAGGFVADLYRLAALLERSPELTVTETTRWLVRDCALLAATLLVVLCGGLGWFLATQWHTAVTAARMDLLGLGRRLHRETKER